MKIRNCPKCDKELVHASEKGCRTATNRERVCRSCAQQGRLPWNKGMRGVQVAWNRGLKKETDERVLKYANSLIGSGLGKKLPKTNEAKKNSRVAAIKRMERNYGQVFPNYNPLACKAIDEYGKQHGYNFQHAENGGEFHIKDLGYWVDGYDKEKNVVIEYDEKYHKYKKEKDEQRRKEIEAHLQCKFIILQENNQC